MRKLRCPLEKSTTSQLPSKAISTRTCTAFTPHSGQALESSQPTDSSEREIRNSPCRLLKCSRLHFKIPKLYRNATIIKTGRPPSNHHSIPTNTIETPLRIKDEEIDSVSERNVMKMDYSGELDRTRKKSVRLIPVITGEMDTKDVCVQDSAEGVGTGERVLKPVRNIDLLSGIELRQIRVPRRSHPLHQSLEHQRQGIGRFKDTHGEWRSCTVLYDTMADCNFISQTWKVDPHLEVFKVPENTLETVWSPLNPELEHPMSHFVSIQLQLEDAGTREVEVELFIHDFKGDFEPFIILGHESMNDFGIHISTPSENRELGVLTECETQVVQPLTGHGRFFAMLKTKKGPNFEKTNKQHGERSRKKNKVVEGRIKADKNAGDQVAQAGHSSTTSGGPPPYDEASTASTHATDWTQSPATTETPYTTYTSPASKNTNG